MAKETKDVEVIKEKSVTVNDNKTPKVKIEGEAVVAPVKDETTVEAPEADDIKDVIALLNILDTNTGGKGAIAEIPEALRGSVKYLVDQLTFIKDLFADPLYMAILDDLADQKEDGTTPSVEVAIARNIPMEKLQALAESEDYEGAQGELTDNLAMQKQVGEEDAQYEANFTQSQKAGEEYAAEMGYDEARKNELFQKVLDLLTIMGDGVLTKVEFADVDKMLNYGPDTESLRAQLSEQDSKEVLPDQASVEATISGTRKPAPSKPTTGPGMQSLGSYDDVNAKITGTGKRKRV